MKPKLRYKKTPPEIIKVIGLFYHHHLTYNLFKCEHIFDGENKNLDILFLKQADYHAAGQLLLQRRFVLYLQEKVERYKQMYTKLSNKAITAIHLHREIAWHGVKPLNKKYIFTHARQLAPGIVVPSFEDSLLIHAAHVLFENFKLGPRELKWMPEYLKMITNFNYLREQTIQKRWNSGLNIIFKKLKNDQKITASEIIAVYLTKLNLKEVIYLFKKCLRFLLSRCSWRRKGALFAFIGVNGAGKTTTAIQLETELQPLGKFLHHKIRYYYFGWKPFSPWAKMISRGLSDKDTFKKLTSTSDIKDAEGISKTGKPRKPQNGIKKMFGQACLVLFYLFNYGEYLLRYVLEIYPRLRKGEVIIADRYFYDLYGQYPFSRNSSVLKLLFKLFPKPDYTFILDTNLSSLLKRDKSSALKFSLKEQRRIKPSRYLGIQQELYMSLSKNPKTVYLLTQNNQNITTDKITNFCWRLIVAKRFPY